MKILCTQEFPGDLRMLGSVAAAAPPNMDFVLLPPLSEVLNSPQVMQGYAQGAQALLTCHLWSPAALKALFPTLPLVVLPHNACPVKGHYWFQPVLDHADIFLCTGKSLARKTRLLSPSSNIINVPYPRLEEYRVVAREAGPPEYDLVFACTSYSHYGPLMGIPNEAACWIELIPALAAKGFKIAVLQHQGNQALDAVPGVDYFDQPNAEILFSCKAVISDIASNGLIAAALGKTVFQVVDRDGEIEPRLASHRGFLRDIFDIGPKFGRDWTADTLHQFYPFGSEGMDLKVKYHARVAEHINHHLPAASFYERLAGGVKRDKGMQLEGN